MKKQYTDYTITIEIRLKGDDPLLFDNWIERAIAEQLESGEFIDTMEINNQEVLIHD